MPMGKRAMHPSTRRFLAHGRTQSIGYQREVHSQLETIEGVLKGTVTVCTGGRVHTDWWQLRQVARVLKEDAAKAGFREAVLFLSVYARWQIKRFLVWWSLALS